MKRNEQQLVEFLFKLIDIQIKKYSKLAKFGVGPDAKTSAALIRSQVKDLLTRLENFLCLEEISSRDVVKLAQTVKFYLDCEYLRGRAGWLLDDNKIHNTVYERVTTQQKELSALCEEMDDWSEIDMSTLTVVQQQYLYDSHAIALRILNLAAMLKDNPDRTDLGQDNNLGHGLVIMRRHARSGGRYHDVALGTEIVEKLAISKCYLESSTFSKSIVELNQQAAEICCNEDKATLQKLLKSYLEKYPKSDLAKADFAWFQVAEIPIQSSARPLVKWGLFAAGVVAAGVATMLAVKNVELSDDNRLMSWFGL